jgi:hypothetical protein
MKYAALKIIIKEAMSSHAEVLPDNRRHTVVPITSHTSERQ